MPEHLKDFENGTLGETSIFSFIVRVWGEETGTEADPVTWRGHMTPIGKGERHYFSDIDEISILIRAYLEPAGKKTIVPPVKEPRTP